MRRAELGLVFVVLILIALAALVAEQIGPTEVLDSRRSTLLDGPQGVSGLARALERLAVAVEQRRRPLFDWDVGGGDRTTLLAVLDPTLPLTSEERRAIRNSVAQGGVVFLAGSTGVEWCFGFEVDHMLALDDTGVAVLGPEGTSSSPPVQAVVRRVPVDSLRGEPDEGSEECPLLAAITVDTLLRTEDGRAAALRLSYRQGGEALILGDSRLVSNRVLKETEAGLTLIPWLLASAPKRVVFDEYHHGFQHRQSIVWATWRWILGSPIGWLVLQSVVVGLGALGYSAVRFGPALSAVERRRRSPLEHLDALAAGLERSRGADEAVSLLSRGLRRRLIRVGAVSGHGTRERDWIAQLALAVRSPGARAKVERLGRLTRESGEEKRVLEMAQTVEDVWQLLGRERRPINS